MTGRRRIAIHAEQGPDARWIRWVLPDGTLPDVGAVRQAPPDIWRLVCDGVLAEVRVQGGHVLTRAADGVSWRDIGEGVRAAVSSAIADPGGWVGERTADEALEQAVIDVLDGAAGEVIRSHGGTAELVSVQAGVVILRFGGACKDCPALGFTLQSRIVAELRARAPQLVDVQVARDNTVTASRAPRWPRRGSERS